MSCVFCRIVRGELPADVVFDDGDILAFLDLRPLFPGHVLVVPKAHHETLADLPPELVGPLYDRVRTIAVAVERAMAAGGTFVAQNNKVSQSVPHVHVHVVPRTKGDGLKGFFWPRKDYGSDEERARVRDAIRAALG